MEVMTLLLELMQSLGIELRGNMCCCPFHMESGPSFKYYPDTDSFYCFGCKKGGGVRQFVRYWLGEDASKQAIDNFISNRVLPVSRVNSMSGRIPVRVFVESKDTGVTEKAVREHCSEKLVREAPVGDITVFNILSIVQDC